MQPPSTIVSILNNPLTPLVGLFFLFYFIFILPEKRRKVAGGFDDVDAQEE